MKTGEQTISLPPRARVIHYLRQALAAGVFAPGDQLPSEQELCRQVRVSRTTVRAALQTLEAEHFLNCEGRRRFISAALPGNRRSSLKPSRSSTTRSTRRTRRAAGASGRCSTT